MKGKIQKEEENGRGAGAELKRMIENVCTIISINQAISYRHERYGVVRVTLSDIEGAVKVVEELDGHLFHNVRVSNKLYTLIQHYHSFPDTEGKQYMREFLYPLVCQSFIPIQYAGKATAMLLDLSKDSLIRLLYDPAALNFRLSNMAQILHLIPQPAPTVISQPNPSLPPLTN